MGQKMKNAPVYFAIVQARFNPMPALDSFAPRIQERLRRQSYPDAQTGALTTFNLNLGAPGEPLPARVPVAQATRYLSSNIDRTAGFILDHGALSYQTTEYDVFERFLDAFLIGLRTVHEVVDDGLSYTERLGVRYLDAVLPRTGEVLSSYLSDSLLGLYGKIEGKIVHAFSETLSKLDSVSVIARTIIQDGAVGFPPDLQPMNITLAERFSKYRGPHAVLDTDGSREARAPFDLDVIHDHLYGIHDQISKSFHASVTEHALNVWS